MAKDDSGKSKKGWFIGCGGCLGLLIIIVVGFSACSALFVDGVNSSIEEKEQEREEMESTEYSVNEPMDHEGKVVTVTNVEKQSPQSYDAIQEGYEYVVVRVKVDNESEEEISYNVMNFSLQDGNGNITEAFAGGSLDHVSEMLSSGKLAPGGSTEGNLVFEVPEGDQDLQLRYEASFWNDTQIKFNLYE